MRTIDHELYENAQKRIRQKRYLFIHFVLFCIGSLFLLVAEKVFSVWQTQANWSFWIILVWGFLWIYHLANVFILKRFMSKQWEREEIDRLIIKQKQRIEQLKQKVEQDYPINDTDSK